MQLKPLYAIRHKPTGKFIPHAEGTAGRGGSFAVPTDPKVKPVRLFKSDRSAKGFLGQWLRGEHHGEWDWDDSDWYGSTKYCIGANVHPKPDRVREDMEVVTINLEVGVPV